MKKQDEIKLTEAVRKTDWIYAANGNGKKLINVTMTYEMLLMLVYVIRKTEFESGEAIL